MRDRKRRRTLCRLCDLNGRMCWNGTEGNFVSFGMRMGEKQDLKENTQGTLYWNYLIKKMTAIAVIKCDSGTISCLQDFKFSMHNLRCILVCA